MRFLALGTALALLLAGCGGPPKAEKPIAGILYDGASFGISDAEVEFWKQAGVTDLLVKAGALSYSTGRPTSTVESFEWRRLAAGLPVTLVLELGGPDLSAMLEADWRKVANDTTVSLHQAMEKARNAGVRPAGIQIAAGAADLPVRPLADLIRYVRQQFRSDMPVSVAVPASVLEQGTAKRLARRVSYMVFLQPVPAAGMAAKDVQNLLPSPSGFQRMAERARDLGSPFSFVIDTRVQVFAEGEHGLAVSSQAAGLTATHRYDGPQPGTEGSATHEVGRWIKGTASEGDRVAAAPHVGGVHRVLQALVKSGVSDYRGPILSAPPAIPDDLSLTVEGVRAALTGEECLPEPQITIRPVPDVANSIQVELSNTGCGRTAVADNAVRIRISYPRGAVASAQAGGFRTAQILKTVAGQTLPTEAATSDTIVLEAPHLVQGTLQTGSITLRPGQDGKMKITAVLEAPGDQPARTGSIEVQLR